MWLTDKIIITTILVCFSAEYSEENILWNIFNGGRSIFMQKLQPVASQRVMKKLSESRVGDYDAGGGNMGVEQDQGYGEVEHREVDDNNKPDYSPHSSAHGHHGYQHPPTDYVYSHAVSNGNLNLYTLLGGLSFASLLATTFIILSRRNGSFLRSFEDDEFSTRKNRNIRFGQIKVPEVILHLTSISNNPWWKRLNRTNWSAPLISHPEEHSTS